MELKTQVKDLVYQPFLGRPRSVSKKALIDDLPSLLHKAFVGERLRRLLLKNLVFPTYLGGWRGWRECARRARDGRRRRKEDARESSGNASEEKPLETSGTVVDVASDLDTIAMEIAGGGGDDTAGDAAGRH